MMVASIDPVGQTVSAGLRAARPDRRAARQRRRLRAEAELAARLRRPPPERLSRRRHRRRSRMPSARCWASRSTTTPASSSSASSTWSTRSGGVDIDVTQGFDDPTYDGFGFDQMGFEITAGRHHLDGLDALAYARARARPAARATSRELPASSRSSWRCAMPSPRTVRCCGSCRDCWMRSARPSARTCPSSACRS